MSSESNANTGKRRGRWIAGIILIAALIGGYVAFVGTSEGDAAEDADVILALNSTAVVRTDLVELEDFDGTLRAVEQDNITAANSGVITAVAAEGTALDEGDLVYAVDGTAVPLLVAPTDFYRDLSVGDDTIMVEATRAGTITNSSEVGTIVEQGDVLYTFDGEPVTVLYGDSVVYRDLYWPEPAESTTRSTLASDVQSEQSRAGRRHRLGNLTRQSGGHCGAASRP